MGLGRDAESSEGEPGGEAVVEAFLVCLVILGIERAPSEPLPKEIALPPNLAVIS